MNDRQTLVRTIALRESFRGIFLESLANALSPTEKEFAQNEYNFIDNELKFLYNVLQELNNEEETT